MPENDKDDVPNVVVLSYQDDDCESVHAQLHEGHLENEEASKEDGVTVEASVVDDLRGRREEGQEDESIDSEDETGWQYASDNEGLPIISEEDDSDYD